jgi:ATP sulfurylase
LEVVSHFTADWEDAAERLYGTRDMDHPGVSAFLSAGKTALAGRVWITNRGKRPGKQYELTPAQTRRLFEARGWTRVVGFHTRNAPHRVHEHVMEEAVRQTHADGIFIHPAVGKKKKGDFNTAAITAGYMAMMEASETLGDALFATFPTYSRYAGPREALFTALCRQNYGCSHFVVGRDHTGVKQYYAPTAAQEIFREFPDIGIEAVLFDEIRYSRTKGGYGSDVRDDDALSISGTEARKMLMSGAHPPAWYLRPEVADAILRLKSEAFVT